jgi:hypothetical protein
VVLCWREVPGVGAWSTRAVTGDYLPLLSAAFVTGMVFSSCAAGWVSHVGFLLLLSYFYVFWGGLLGLIWVHDGDFVVFCGAFDVF